MKRLAEYVAAAAIVAGIWWIVSGGNTPVTLALTAMTFIGAGLAKIGRTDEDINEFAQQRMTDDGAPMPSDPNFHTTTKDE